MSLQNQPNDNHESVMTADELLDRAKAGDTSALQEASEHPEAWREMTDEEIMATKISLKDGCFGASVIIYGLMAVALIVLILFVVLWGVFFR